MKKKPGPFVYTNIGLPPKQHKRLKHLAVEESRNMASLVREAIDLYLDRQGRKNAAKCEDDFVLHKLGRSWVAKEERPYRPELLSQVDRDLYGGSPHE